MEGIGARPLKSYPAKSSLCLWADRENSGDEWLKAWPLPEPAQGGVVGAAGARLP